MTADRVLGRVGDVLDDGGAAADVGQLEEAGEVAVDDLGVGAVGAVAAVARDFEDVACGPDDPGGVGVTQGDPLLLLGRGGGLGPGELRGDKSAGGEGCGRAEQGQTSAQACHESSMDAVLALL
ncbi:hypothetical protein ABZY30_29515 [Streptomyces massasporeus]|uniref:hypothetical protein n=1 Tax=Streptomyces massasporeus TaxID=67324 RepID=UPI0033A9A561